MGFERLSGHPLQPQEKAFASVEEWRNGFLDWVCPYVYVGEIHLKRSWRCSHGNVAMMVAIGVNDDGCRAVMGAVERSTESAECWREFLS
ncbi:transposase [Olsenella sp. An290]|uniref:transposase n=1 Tax=Olsenella sp. An290 TaxID=1965625 RepID=UPI001302857A|nr:transposase [Olsenella sp. An290]